MTEIEKPKLFGIRHSNRDFSDRDSWGKNQFMKGEILRNPRIKRDEIKDIILGGGQNLLSPERRFDAIIFNTPDLF